MYHDDHTDALRYMHMHFKRKDKERKDKEMDINDKKAWDNERVQDILKAAYDLQNLCKTSLGCCGCPFRGINGNCAFKSNPVVPLSWSIEEKTVYTVKLPPDT